mmetsp:Transcript_4404/g.3648  ORF Transcript_4404/g.3648 Transcript_4404/m.3648 type:complete len:123 (-) Transcript_4404:1234-1602(-)|eukprot:CAMPEP_0114580436 /NCGR_PEP_ID=MMETSP0125-20121206/4723_1 /TAXON_ID=485358 ORGANISM="Aristerostoma sp., Strain ATCC 50986" /NCGR_SAMPLE_ID=MMETSP0125 /ASSEMBLY_ACC=CAM_ASM_000245 /LENGTH=122 /DNA_ID=CAMNT_0001771999 /DNA_START=427 /DNA_END=795 /DNA_ORIENTATION=+
MIIKPNPKKHDFLAALIGENQFFGVEHFLGLKSRIFKASVGLEGATVYEVDIAQLMDKPKHDYTPIFEVLKKQEKDRIEFRRERMRKFLIRKGIFRDIESEVKRAMQVVEDDDALSPIKIPT